MAISQSANQAFFGSSGPCRYVPMTVPRAHALGARAPGVAVPAQHAPERRLATPEVGAPAVVLEAREHARAVEAGELDLDGDVADEPWPVRSHRAQVDEPDAGDPLGAQLVVVAEQLRPPQTASTTRPVGRRRVQRVALALDHVERA